MRYRVPVERLTALGERGLSSEEVQARRQKYGSNEIVEVAGSPFLDIVHDTARDPMIWFLVGTAALYGLLGSTAEALTLVVAIAPLVGMDAFLHRRTRASTEALSRRIAARAHAVRDGADVEISTLELVPGDLIRIEPGELLPADGVFVSAENVQIDESTLTGEAYPVRKRALTRLPSGPGEIVVDGVYWGFAGTRALTGRGLVRLALTGRETLYGEIVRSAVLGTKAHTPLQRAIHGLVAMLVVAAMVLCAILAFVRFRQGHGWVDAVVSAATLAVAALPEEFPVVFSIFLGVGVYRLAKKKALVRRAVSVENVGRISCICSDKTGTITEGRLRLEELVPSESVSPTRLLTLAALASRSETSDPVDEAIRDRARVELSELSNAEVRETFPFTENRRRETAIVRWEGELLAAVKGSPETVLEMSVLSDEERTRWKERATELASHGRKVLACGSKNLGARWRGGEPADGFCLAGLLVCEDAIREGVAEAVAACRASGIKVVMVTGDHPETALSVARQIGLGGTEPRVLFGEELETASLASIRDVDVIARALPAQKLSLVRSLQSAGEIVAVTGDGVNDVPALQAADVGLAMGERGTRSAREVASIVLLDDNFRTIVLAVAEGRQLFENLKSSFAYLLMIHAPLVITAALVPLAGYPLLYLPIHIVWLETIIHPTALLAFQELPATGRLGRPRWGRRIRFFERWEWVRIGAVGALSTLLVTATYDRSLGPAANVDHARAMALVALTTASAAMTAFSSGLRTRASRILVAFTIGISFLLVQAGWFARRLHLEPLHADDWMIAAAGALVAVGLPFGLSKAASEFSFTDTERDAA